MDDKGPVTVSDLLQCLIRLPQFRETFLISSITDT